jgi:hypothetical protein
MFENDAESIKFLADENVKAKLANAKKLSAVSAKVILCYVFVDGWKTENP